ncbi:MAG: type III PLP-dependent enzyme [Dongiaceae bacterium]
MSDDFPHFRSPAEMVAAWRPDEPVYCIDRPSLVGAAQRFVSLFPGHVLYAVKCNPLPFVLDALYQGGIRHFDTASIAEIELVGRRFPGVQGHFMHPVKSPQAIRRAFDEFGVRHYVIDHAAEIDKMIAVLGNDRRETVTLVRLATPSKGAKFNLSAKFGATPDKTVSLLRALVDAGFQPGLCFHVGSQCLDPEAWTLALDLVGTVLRQSGVAIRCLDVGGGFPAAYVGETPPPLETFIDVIARGVAKLALPADCILMCEPGRALVAPAMSLIARVELATGEAIHLNDGIYGSLIGATIGIRWPIALIRPDGPAANDTRGFRVYGPTCDNLDTLPYEFELPVDVRTGDYVRIDRLGAYAVALRTGFNGFLPNRFVTVDRLA